MKMDKVYNKIANTYNQHMSADILAQSKKIAIDTVLSERPELSSILALGVGDASDLLLYKNHYPKAEFHGLDISKKMLERAKAAMGCHTYHGNIANASTIIDKDNFDLITAYFVSAYVPMPSILAECSKLLPKNGLVSILTTTMESFPGAQAVFQNSISSLKYFDKPFVPHIRKALKSVNVPIDMNQLQTMVESNGFKIHEIQQKEIPLYFTTEQEVLDFFINGSWFAIGLSHPLIPVSILRRMCVRWIREYVTLPYEDVIKVSVVLGERI